MVYMSVSGTDKVDDPIEEKNEAENDKVNPPRRGKIIREAMRDVLISVILLVLTTLVTYGDFEKSPASSILASGKCSKQFMITYRVFKVHVNIFDPYPDQTSVDQNAFPDFLKVRNLWKHHKKLSFCPISLPVLDFVSW